MTSPGEALASLVLALIALIAPPAGTSGPEAAPAPASSLAWHECGGPFECTRIDVPLDYDDPDGEQISVAMIKLPATDPAHRVGSLFVNPGGPGNSGIDFVRGDARGVLPAPVQRRFDIVGFDPRGVGRSTPVRCFASVTEQQEFFSDVPAFPVGAAQRAEYADQMARLAGACAALNPSLLDHLSTANVARDLDVMRAAVGDERLSFAGYSYGTLLGQTYAGLFPDRVRALSLDGILDPVAWTTGRGQRDATVPFSLRVGGATATAKAMDFFLDACQRAGSRGCAFASADTHGKFDRLMRRLRHHPVVLDEGGGPETFTYADVVDGLRGGLTFPPVWPDIGGLLETAQQAPPAGRDTAERATVSGAGRYDNSREALLAVACSEADHPTDPAVWDAQAGLAESRSPHFGADWTYVSAACAGWQGHDEDRYTGPFDRVTYAPALLVNARFDAASPYARAVRVQALMPGSRLLTLAGPGHPASFTGNGCLNAVITDYLVKGALPDPGTVCRPEHGPFER